MQTINLLFPIEGMMRELDFRLVLAVKYAEKHHRIFIGQTFSCFRVMDETDGGVFVGKAISAPWPRSPLAPFDKRVGRVSYDVIKMRGFSVVHLSEEGAIFTGTEASWADVLDFQLDPCIMQAEDFILTWGDWQRDYYRAKSPRVADHIRTTGHPRFDLYAPEYAELFREDAEAIRARFGTFVLVNTNFGLALHPQGPDVLFSAYEGYDPSNPELRERFIAQWSRVNRTMPSFVELVHFLSLRRPDVNIVLRPHPSDDPALYHAAFRGIPNVHVLREGSVVPWLIAASIVVHDGCTTGLESYLLDRPVLNYRPVPGDPTTDHFLANIFGWHATTREEALEIIQTHLEHPDRYRPLPPRDGIPERAHNVFASFRTRGYPLMMETMREAERTMRGGGVGPSVRRVAAEERAELAVEAAKRVVRPLFRRQYLSAKQANVVFYGLDRSAIAKRLATVERVVGRKVEMTYHSRNLIELRGRSPAASFVPADLVPPRPRADERAAIGLEPTA